MSYLTSLKAFFSDVKKSIFIGGNNTVTGEAQQTKSKAQRSLKKSNLAL